MRKLFGARVLHEKTSATLVNVDTDYTEHAISDGTVHEYIHDAGRCQRFRLGTRRAAAQEYLVGYVCVSKLETCVNFKGKMPLKK